MAAIICRGCGAFFETDDHRRRYCGPQCRCQTQIGRVQGSALEVRQWEGHAIQRRRADGYVNATAMCQANGKKWNDYARLDRTAEYMAALDRVLRSAGFPADPIHVITTGPNQLRGTWIHPRLAVDLARWCRPAFAVWMDGWLLGQLGATDPTPAPRPQAIAPLHDPDYSWLRRLSPIEQCAHLLLMAVQDRERPAPDDPAPQTELAVCNMAAAILHHYLPAVPGGRRALNRTPILPKRRG